MRPLSVVKILPVLVAMFVFTGCAIKQPAPVAMPEAKQISADNYTNKVDNFMVLMDASYSMTYDYNGKSKFDIAKSIANYMNKTMPDMKINGAMKTFGHAPEVTSDDVMTTWKQAPYSKDGLKAGIDKVKTAGGLSPVGSSLAAAYEDIKNYKGSTAVIVITDGEEMDTTSINAPLEGLKALGNVCVYTIQVGDSGVGSRFLKNLGNKNGCGFLVNANEISNPEKMGIFVKKVFLKEKAGQPKAAPVAIEGDKDGDGVKDSKDDCPDTPKGAKVNEKGCWVLAGVLFDTGKATLKPEGMKELDKAAKVLKENPDLKIEVQGHTDNVGSKDLNMKLSDKRAKTVMDYLAAKAGIEASRMTSKGYGFDKPAAPNTSEAGKAKNRRVQLNPVRR